MSEYKYVDKSFHPSHFNIIASENPVVVKNSIDELDKHAQIMDMMGLEIWSGRNYDLFAFLADVRNDGGITPLDEPRSRPKDASDSYLWACSAWGENSHSHSWFILEELLKVDRSFWSKINCESFIERLDMIDGDSIEIRICFFFDS